MVAFEGFHHACVVFDGGDASRVRRVSSIITCSGLSTIALTLRPRASSPRTSACTRHTVPTRAISFIVERVLVFII